MNAQATRARTTESIHMATVRSQGVNSRKLTTNPANTARPAAAEAQHERQDALAFLHKLVMG